MSQDPTATEDMCRFCFDVLHAHFRGETPPLFPGDGSVSCPMFVTLNILDDRSHKRLRGCIGTLNPKPLNEMSYYVISSAFRDSRFSPLREEELPKLSVSVSLLVRYEPANNYLDWQLDIHGIIIEFSKSGRHYSATYLPEVALEQGWSHTEAVESLIRKSGYRGSINQQLLDSIRVTRYQSSKFSLSYAEVYVMPPQDIVPRKTSSRLMASLESLLK